MEPQDLDEEEVTEGIENISVDEVEPISRLPPYIPLQNPTSKVTKDPDAIKFKVFTHLLLVEVPIEGDLLYPVQAQQVSEVSLL